MNKVKESTLEIIETILKNDKGVDELKKEKVRAVLTGGKIPIEAKTLNLSEAAAWLGLSRVTAHILVKKGYLKPVIIGDGIKRYRVSDLEKLIRDREENR